MTAMPKHSAKFCSGVVNGTASSVSAGAKNFRLDIARVRPSHYQCYVLQGAPTQTRAMLAAHSSLSVSHVSSIVTTNVHHLTSPTWPTITILMAPFFYTLSARKLSTFRDQLSTYSDIDVSGMGFLNTIVRDNYQTARFSAI